MSLATAEEKEDASRETVALNIDPITEKQRLKVA